jgi:hypothetical protein
MARFSLLGHRPVIADVSTIDGFVVSEWPTIVKLVTISATSGEVGHARVSHSQRYDSNMFSKGPAKSEIV